MPSTPNAPRAPPLGSGSNEEGDHDSRSWFESNWMVIVPGFVGGLIFGVAIEHVLAIDRRDWFIRALNVGIAIRRETGGCYDVQLEVATVTFCVFLG